MKKLAVAVVAAMTAIGAAGVLAAQGTTGTAQGAAAAQAPATEAAKPGIATGKSTILQKVIIKVNGEIFAQSELEFRQIQTLRDQNRQVRQGQDLTTDPGLRSALAEVTPGILVDAVDELLVVQHGREMPGMKYSDAQFNKSLDELKKANKLDDKTFPEALKQEGMTMADLRVNMERAWLVQAVQQRELMKNMTLTEEEARQYYNAHQNEFMKPSTVTLREIMIPVPADKSGGGQATFNVSSDEAVKQKVAAVRERALKGEDFATLVKEVSESSTKEGGGVIGPINIADLSPALTELLDKMKPGDITEPLRTKAGYQIIKLEVRSVSEPETFEKSRDQIGQHILNGRLDVERAKFIERLLLEAVIEWKDDNYKKMYDTERAARMKAASRNGK